MMQETPLARLFGEGMDQVVLIRGQNDDADPAVLVFFYPKVEGLNTSQVVMGYKTEKDRDKNFMRLTEGEAFEIRDGIRRQLEETFGGLVVEEDDE